MGREIFIVCCVRSSWGVLHRRSSHRPEFKLRRHRSKSTLIGLESFGHRCLVLLRGLELLAMGIDSTAGEWAGARSEFAERSCTYLLTRQGFSHPWLIAKVLLRGLNAECTRVLVHFNGLELLAMGLESTADWLATENGSKISVLRKVAIAQQPISQRPIDLLAYGS